MGTTVGIIKVRYDTVRRVCSIRGNGGNGGGLETLGWTVVEVSDWEMGGDVLRSGWDEGGNSGGMV